MLSAFQWKAIPTDVARGKPAVGQKVEGVRKVFFVVKNGICVDSNLNARGHDVLIYGERALVCDGQFSPQCSRCRWRDPQSFVHCGSKVLAAEKLRANLDVIPSIKDCTDLVD